MKRISLVLLGLVCFSVYSFAQAPHVDSTSPYQNQLNVAADAVISVTFDIDMNPLTVNDSTFMAHARSTGLHKGTISYDPISRTATLDPYNDFAVGEVITITLTSRINSWENVPLDKGFIWEFTVEVSYESPGTFIKDAEYDVGGVPSYIFVADIDGNGFQDIATANVLTHDISILYNNGNAGFELDTNIIIGNISGGISITAADYNNDGKIDLAASNYTSNNVSVLINNGDSTFSHSIYTCLGNPHDIYSSDLNADGYLDIATANYSDSSVSVFYNNNDGTFHLDSSYYVGVTNWSIRGGDLNSDGYIDIATSAREGFSDSGYASVLLNDDYGKFNYDSTYIVGASPYSVFAADLDNDSCLDLSTANVASAGPGDISIIINNCDGIFGNTINYLAGGFPVSIFAADIDGDGDLDIASANHVSDNISILSNNGDAIFNVDSIYPDSNDPCAIFAADLDNDRDLDLVVAKGASDNISVFLNKFCEYLTGDVNNSGSFNGLDITYGVNYFKGGAEPLCPNCPLDDCDSWHYCGDVNGSCSYNGLDITYGVSYLKGEQTELIPCIDCPPVG